MVPFTSLVTIVSSVGVAGGGALHAESAKTNRRANTFRIFITVISIANILLCGTGTFRKELFHSFKISLSLTLQTDQIMN